MSGGSNVASHGGMIIGNSPFVGSGAVPNTPPIDPQQFYKHGNSPSGHPIFYQSPMFIAPS